VPGDPRLARYRQATAEVFDDCLLVGHLSTRVVWVWSVAGGSSRAPALPRTCPGSRRGCRGAEQHRDEFRALAEYLNDLAEVDPERGIKVWLVEAKAVRIASGPWAPLFNAVVQPNSFTASVEVIKKAESHGTLEDFWLRFDSDSCRAAAEQVVGRWQSTGYPYRIGPGTSHVVLMAPGPSVNGRRTVVAIYPDGRVMVPFASYAGSNSGIPIEALTSEAFRAGANALFGFSGTEKQARTTPGWLRPEVEDDLFAVIQSVASAYKAGAGDPLQ